MCLAIPAKVTKLDRGMATIDIAGVTHPVSLALLTDASVGDYVIVHAGFAIHKIDPKEAQESLKIIQELKEIE